ncbi:MAG: metallophosphoesterase [Nanoarchaeota archaeon]|nr:metallophosphoesterase [Nanoarchaeota archaeon]
MKVLAFSDIHGNWYQLMKLKEKEADLVIVCGDLKGKSNNVEYGLSILAEFNKKVLIVPGNFERPEEVDEWCLKYDFINLHGRLYEFMGYKFFGIGGALRGPFNTPFEMEEEDFERFLKGLKSDDKTILVTHNPPYKCVDRTTVGIHIGSKALRDFIERNVIKLCLCGHVHERAGESCIINDTKVINVGKKGVVIEL